MSVFMIIAIIFFVIAVLLLAVTITLFFTQNIIAVIGDLSGKTAQKQIQQIRAQGASVVRTTNRKVSSNKSNTAFDNMLSNSQARETGPTDSRKNASNSPRKQRTVSKTKNGTVSFDNGFTSIGQTPTGNISTVSGVVKSDSGTDVLSSNFSAPAADALSTEAPTGVLDTTEAPTGVLDATEAPTGVLDATEAPTGVLDATEAPTGVLDATEAPTGVFDATEAPTGMLSDDVYSESATSILSGEIGTTLLSEDAGTTVLSNNEDSEAVGFKITSDETFAVTDTSID